MENQDKIFNQFKTAAEKEEIKDFDSMDKVWNRIEDKLDHAVIQKQSRVWKKLAIAASVLLVSSIGYQFLKSDPIKKPVIQNEMVVMDTASIKEEKIIVEKADTLFKSEAIKPEANSILKRKQNSKARVADISKKEEQSEPKTVVNNYYIRNNYGPTRKTRMARQYHPDPIIVREVFIEKEEVEKEKEILEDKKSSSLYVIDGKAVTSKNEKMEKILNDPMLKVSDEDIEYILELKEPLYIIDNKYYSEAQLFGPKPTSPYAPLNEQDIQTISVLESDEAIPIYGDRGAKGVVIIKTKNGKPAVISKKE